MHTNITTVTAPFHGTPVTVIHHLGQPWITAEDAGRCLGYSESNASAGIRNLYSRHSDEFNGAEGCINLMHPLDTTGEGETNLVYPLDTTVINLMTKGGPQDVRLFSQTGCIKLGFFASTLRSKAFRQWAAQVLAGAPALPAVAPRLAGAGCSITRVAELQVLQLFVAGHSYKDIGRVTGISKGRISLLVHGKHAFSPSAGPDLTTPALLAQVAQRLVGSVQQQIVQRFGFSSANTRLQQAIEQASVAHLGYVPPPAQAALA